MSTPKSPDAVLEPAKPAGKVIGRPFVKGQSGNPGGKPKGMAEFAELCRNRIRDESLLDELVDLARAWREDKKLASASVAALKEIFERGYGKSSITLGDGEKGALEALARALTEE